MPAVPLLYKPNIQEWETSLGPVRSADINLQLEILNQLVGLNANAPIVIVTNMKQITDVTAGQTYTNAALVNATIFNVFYGGARLNGTTNPDYTFDDTTGEITFLIDITDGLELAIDYTTNP